MNTSMAERIRLIIDTDEETRLAVRLAATAAGVSTSELVTTILKRALVEELKDARKYTAKRKKDEG